ncbi:L-fuculose-phosphate aldolase [Cohaesibacter sp. ES.047]|uniref:class II aldolase/adducin family protein n=1 Tax=Cohaesibacter sp. ES.047 TaxID=1798205 RepID=UPI000BB708C9|nr:class II aldolase/adducin family protein [Cohaesibacter sp. ES.047]SNY92368.1 L-fuculose-phosphate aldolase [Cohaesibacter sp. ES.047]
MNYNDFKTERECVAYFMRRLYQNQLTTCSGGNLSMRLDEKHVIITPSSLDKGVIEAGEIGLVTIDGENLTPHLKSSIETGMHLEIFRRRPDVKAVVHAHPVMASTFAAVDKDINTTLTAESYLVLGNVVNAPYALMGSKELSVIVGKAAENSNVIVMKNHGITTVGKSMLDAFDKMELLEASAKMTINAAILGGVSPLTAEQRAQLDNW